MVLVDTSVWISHLRESESHLKSILETGEVACHPFIIGELACGNLKNRSEILTLLHELPTAKIADHNEILNFIEKHSLMGTGLGLIDIHLLASSMLSNVPLWTSDKSLKAASVKLNFDYNIE